MAVSACHTCVHLANFCAAGSGWVHSQHSFREVAASSVVHMPLGQANMVPVGASCVSLRPVAAGAVSGCGLAGSNVRVGTPPGPAATRSGCDSTVRECSVIVSLPTPVLSERKMLTVKEVDDLMLQLCCPAVQQGHKQCLQASLTVVALGTRASACDDAAAHVSCIPPRQ